MNEEAAKIGSQRESKKQANRFLVEPEGHSDSENESYAARNHENLDNEPIKLEPQKYGCPFCSKIMRSPSDMKRHILTHTGEKPFSCNKCEMSFNLKGNLKAHMMKCHLEKE